MRNLLTSSFLLALASACVTTGTYNRKVAELNQARAADDAAATTRENGLKAKLAARIKADEDKATGLQKQIADLDAQLAKAKSERDGLRQKLDASTSLVSALEKRLERLGQNVNRLTSEKGQLAQAMAETNARLEELRKEKAAAEARAVAFRSLVRKLRSMIDAGQLKVAIRNGRMVIQLPNDVLFDSGSTTLKPAGQKAIAQVATVLATIPDRHFLVAGETDNVPIHTARFPSNWELSTARAVVVVKFMVAHGVRPEALAAAGYGEYDPVVPNDTPEHRAENRRIEIVLQPNLSDLPPIEGITTTASDDTGSGKH